MRRAPHRVAAISVAIALGAVATAVLAQPGGGGDADGDGKVTVALLPLDAEAKLALYGQPVAAAISAALADEGLDVAVVGQGDPVPTRAVLVVDGEIVKKGKGIKLVLRISDPARAKVLAEVLATAATLTKIDKAASDAAAKLIPQVRTQLAEIAARSKPPEPGSATGTGSGTGTATATATATGTGSGSAVVVAPKPVVPGILLVATSRVALDGRPDAVVAAIAPAFERLIGDAHHRPVPPTGLTGDKAEALANAARIAGADLVVSVDVLALDVEAGAVPFGRARARIRIIAAATGKPVFDRVVRTDTVVGKKGEVAAHIAGYAGVQLAEVMRVRVMKAAAASGGEQ